MAVDSQTFYERVILTLYNPRHLTAYFSGHLYAVFAFTAYCFEIRAKTLRQGSRQVLDQFFDFI